MRDTLQFRWCLILCMVPGVAFAQHAAKGRRSPEKPGREIAQPAAASGTGTARISIKDIVGRPVPGEVEIRPVDGGRGVRASLPEGTGETLAGAGASAVYIRAISEGLAMLVDVQDVEIRAGETVDISFSLLEGTAGNRPLVAFDTDLDQAIDSVELKVGTDPRNAASIPGLDTFTWPSPVIDPDEGWYRGEFHVHSSHGTGGEDVGRLVDRAEGARLDFLAITDRDTLAPAFDEDFKSKSVVLIPAMEWGTEEKGVALLFAPRTMPTPAGSAAEAQAMVYRVQAQGGIVAVAHPCFSAAPWQWDLTHINAVEAWCRDWREVPPLWLERLGDTARELGKNGRAIHAVGFAAATEGLSANGQGAIFYDFELSRGYKACVIGGSNAASAKVAIGRPLTYVFAEQKSLNGILDGLRRGRTYVTSGPDGPQLTFWADWNNDGSIESGIGGFVPFGITSRFLVNVRNAAGKRLEVLLNGYPIRSTKISDNNLTFAFIDFPESYAAYRVRIVESPKKTGFGNLDVLAMTSPIYAQQTVFMGAEGAQNAWVTIEGEREDPDYGSHFIQTDPSKIRELKPERL